MRVFEDMQNYLKDCVATCDGLTLYGCELNPGPKTHTLRIFIESIDPSVGISADDCHRVGQQIRDQSAVSFPSILNYTIEVSSPGLDRILFSIKHCEQHIGKRVKCRCRRAIEGRKNYKAKLHAVQNGQVTLELEDSLHVIDWIDIDKIRLIYEPENKL
ncbi:MAG: ribosome maturation factor RimP [Pseudomonadota bacterium]|nr:ribosome maturation factor RimP [Pseudomonadota bacterium]